jgi:hypothetical protein
MTARWEEGISAYDGARQPMDHCTGFLAVWGLHAHLRSEARHGVGINHGL